mmetsp:Transcript_79247/g.201680  ORF Transcript_79247/g.201680 Transcript_79247/m.201680 type:complete len:419 (-) Transcript_79247:72-1328(-)
MGTPDRPSPAAASPVRSQACATQMAVAPPRVALADVVRLLVSEDVGGWGVLKDGKDQVESVTCEESAETEWHQVLMLTCPLQGVSQGRLVVHIPAWTGAALESRALASRAFSDAGIGPSLLADVWMPVGSERRRVMVSEFLAGGTLTPADFLDGDLMASIGRLYGRLHASLPPSDWFLAKALPALSAEGAFPQGSGPDPGPWASCLWILSWLLRQVPAKNRAALVAAGVDWDFVAAEIVSLPSKAASGLLPCNGLLGRTATVHGDSHGGNVMRDGSGNLRLIDFDMTAAGPAGSEFGFLVLMLFRCGFSPEQVVPREVQRRFVAGYLEERAALNADDGVGATESVEELLFGMHCWGYTGLLKMGLLKMGLLCAMLMENEGHAGKREACSRWVYSAPCLWRTRGTPASGRSCGPVGRCC